MSYSGPTTGGATQSTALLPFNATPLQVQNALAALPGIGAGNVSVSASVGTTVGTLGGADANYNIVFQGALGGSAESVLSVVSNTDLAGTTGFSAPTIASSEIGGTTNQIYFVEFTATAGTFTLSFGGQTTAALNTNATSAQIQTDLESLSSIGQGNVSVTGMPAALDTTCSS